MLSGTTSTKQFRALKSEFQNIIKNCNPFVVTGFTEEEAKEYFTLDDSTVSFEDVYPFTGYNPYLLSIVKMATSKSIASSLVDTAVKEYLCNNLGFDHHSSDGLSNYLQTQELCNTLDFSYYACRCAEVTDDEESKFNMTWLAKHHLAVIETKITETVEVLPDQDDSSTIELSQGDGQIGDRQDDGQSGDSQGDGQSGDSQGDDSLTIEPSQGDGQSRGDSSTSTIELSQGDGQSRNDYLTIEPSQGDSSTSTIELSQGDGQSLNDALTSQCDSSRIISPHLGIFT